MELDLTEAIEAGRAGGLATQCDREPNGCMGECYDAAVRAAAPIIERAVREQAGLKAAENVLDDLARRIEQGHEGDDTQQTTDALAWAAEVIDQVREDLYEH